MKFTLTVPETLNYTPADLMRRFAGNDFGNGRANRYIATHDYYFNTVLYDQKTAKAYQYDHWKIQKNGDGTETVTVFMKEKNDEL